MEEAKREISLSQLRGKSVAIDAYNALYQFMAAIRQPNGTPLMDRLGNVTSHLSGLFYRTVNLVEEGIIPVYVFDGKPPEMKGQEIARRRAIKEEAKEKYEKAKTEGKVQEQRKYAQAVNFLTPKMIEESKTLLKYMGISFLEAPSEGEAQAAYMSARGLVFAAASQDYDSLLFGASRLVRNLTLSGRRKVPNREIYIDIKPELIDLNDLLSSLGITRAQLIDIGILTGTDYNPEGVKGIGPKTALKLIKRYGSIEKAIEASEVTLDFDFKPIREFFLNPPVIEPDIKLELESTDREAIFKLLVGDHDFSPDRVDGAVTRLQKAKEELKREGRQSSLDQWMG